MSLTFRNFSRALDACRRVLHPHRPTPLPPDVVELKGDYSHTWIYPRGIRLHAVTAGEPRNPLILLVHGAWGGWFDYRDVISPLARAGYHVVAVDMRGYGLSDKPPLTSGSSTLRLLVGDLYGTIKTSGHDRAIVIGHGTGGTVAWALALQHPDVVSGLVSVSSSYPADLRRESARRPWMFTTPIRRYVAACMPVPVRKLIMPPIKNLASLYVMANSTRVFASSPRGQHDIALRTQSFSIANTATPRARYIQVEFSIPPHEPQAATGVAPCLFIHDTTQPWVRLAERAQARTPRGFAARHIPGTKNMPHLEQPKLFVDAVLEFVRGIPRGIKPQSTQLAR